jgi:hypothetical protein
VPGGTPLSGWSSQCPAAGGTQSQHGPHLAATRVVNTRTVGVRCAAVIYTNMYGRCRRDRGVAGHRTRPATCNQFHLLSSCYGAHKPVPLSLTGRRVEHEGLPSHSTHSNPTLSDTPIPAPHPPYPRYPAHPTHSDLPGQMLHPAHEGPGVHQGIPSNERTTCRKTGCCSTGNGAA